MKALLFAFIVPAAVSAQTISCPNVLPEGSVTVTQPPAGWTVSTPNPVRLDGAGMMSGSPKSKEYLVPASSKKSKGAASSTWNFQQGEEKWVFCTYGRATVELAKRMDDKATACEVSTRADQGGGVAEIKAVCR